MVTIEIIYSKDSSEDAAIKNLLREIKLENPRIILKEYEAESITGKKTIDYFGILALPAIIINKNLFATGMITKEEILEKIQAISSHE